jgi:hypothetical protein
MEFINILMEIIILEIGKKIFFTDMEYIFLHQLVKDMKDIFNWEKSMDKENIIIKKEIFMMVIGEMIRKMDKVFLFIIKQTIDMMVNGKMEREMDKVNFIII